MTELVCRRSQVEQDRIDLVAWIDVGEKESVSPGCGPVERFRKTQTFVFGPVHDRVVTREIGQAGSVEVALRRRPIPVAEARRGRKGPFSRVAVAAANRFVEGNKGTGSFFKISPMDV